MENFRDWLAQTITALLAWVWDIISSLFTTILVVLNDILCGIIDLFLFFLVHLAGLFPALPWSPHDLYDMFPDFAIDMIGALGLPQLIQLVIALLPVKIVVMILRGWLRWQRSQDVDIEVVPWDD